MPWASHAAAWGRRSPTQGFSGIVPLKPSTEGIENVAFNDFTMGVDTTALVQAREHLRGQRRFLAHRRASTG